MSKLKGIEPQGHSRPSSIEVWRETLDAEDKEWFDAAVVDPRWSTAQLLAVVKTEAGAPFGKDGFHAYRKAAKR